MFECRVYPVRFHCVGRGECVLYPLERNPSPFEDGPRVLSEYVFHRGRRQPCTPSFHASQVHRSHPKRWLHPDPSRWPQRTRDAGTRGTGQSLLPNLRGVQAVPVHVQRKSPPLLAALRVAASWGLDHPRIAARSLGAPVRLPVAGFFRDRVLGWRKTGKGKG